MAPLVFVDANVIIAGAASRTGASYAVLALAEIGLIRLAASRQVLDEAERNMQRKLPAAVPLLAEWLLRLELQVVPDPAKASFLRWLPLIEAKDAPILEAAVQVQADYFLTLNTKHFTPAVAEASNLRIETPAQFIEGLRGWVAKRPKNS
ncbi:MAG: putative toxin-antitoxin system toxin component, PIN family [Candidatus Promineifilaceae bacterium]